MSKRPLPPTVVSPANVTCNRAFCWLVPALLRIAPDVLSTPAPITLTVFLTATELAAMPRPPTSSVAPTGIVNVPLVELNALALATANVTPLVTYTSPLNELLPLKMVVVLAALDNNSPPLPEIALGIVNTLLLRLNTSVPLSPIAPLPNPPPASLTPTCKIPPLMVVPPA